MKNNQVAASKVIEASVCGSNQQKVETMSSKVTTHCFSNSVCNKDEIEVERLQHLDLLKRRNKLFKVIISNNDNEHNDWKYIFYWIMSIFMPLVPTCIWTLIPVHDLFEESQFWFEYPLQMTVSLIPLFSAYVCLNCSHWMNIGYIRKSRNIIRIWIVGSLLIIIIHLSGYITWTKLLSFRYPIPLNAYIYNYILFCGVYGIIWHCFPVNWRMNKSFRSRLKWFIGGMAINQCISMEYTIITKIFFATPEEYQWAIAIFLPLVREMNCWIITTLASKASHGDMMSVSISCTQNVGAGHALFLSYTAASTLTITTSIILFGMDYLINLYLTMKIIWLRKKKGNKVKRQIELVQELVINEMVEFIIPLSYLLCFLTAYFGPNSFLIGNVCNGLWQYAAVDGIDKTLETIAIFFIIDCLSGLSCFLILKIYANINILKALSYLQKEFGMLFAINITCPLNAVSSTNFIS